MKTIKMTVHHGNNRNSITATGETLADAIKQLLAQPLGKYAIDESREGYPIIMRELETDGKARWGWGDYEVIEEPTQKSYQQIAGDSTTDRAVGGDTAPDDQINIFLWGFARGADIDRSEAPAQWAGHSIQLTDNERRAIEQQGEDAGFTEGQQFAKLYDTAPALPAHTPGNVSLDSQRGRISLVLTQDDHSGIVSHIASCFGSTLAEEHGGSIEGNAQRLAQLWNACAGMHDPAAEIKALRGIETALRALINAPQITTSEHHPLIIAARAALKGATK